MSTIEMNLEKDIEILDDEITGYYLRSENLKNVI